MSALYGECSQQAPILDLIELRDSLVDCLVALHGPRFGETRAVLRLDDGLDAVRSSVQGIVKLAYTISGGSFEQPTSQSTTRVVNLLAERSHSWGASDEQVFDHHCQMMRQLGCIIVAESRGAPPEA